jgi:hypothetical protein
MSESEKIPIVETHRGTGIHAFQGPERIEVVKRAIEHVLALRDLKALAEYACDIARPPEARLLAKQVLEDVFALAAESREKQPTGDVDMEKVRLATSALDSLHWIDPHAYGTILETPPGPGAISRKVARDEPLPDDE